MTTKQTPTERALIERGLTPIVADDPAPGLRDDEEMTIYCGRCGGSGRVYSKLDGSRCWGCNATGGALQVTVASQRKKERDRANRANRRMLKDAKEAEAKRNEAVTNWEAFTADHPEIAAQLKSMTGSSFAISLRDRIADTGKLSEAQLEAVARIAAEAAASTPVVEGRQVITGEILSFKFYDNDYGTSLKMTVQDDRGFRVWGTVPSSIVRDLPDSLSEAKGMRVTFTATITKADGDDAFGFFKRPTKASII